jgi:hypothetical protein
LGVTVAITPNSMPIKTDWAVYAIVDQLVWRVPNGKDVKGISVFGRVIGGPTEQNLVNVYADGGVTPLPPAEPLLLPPWAKPAPKTITGTWDRVSGV